MIDEVSTGDQVHRLGKSIAVRFSGKRGVLSTSPLNGGYREDLAGVFNNDCKPDDCGKFELRTATYEGDLQLIARELGFDPQKATGLITAASMDNVSIQNGSFRELTVTAIVTGGIEINGGRAGDPASYYEENETYFPITPGTINIILVIDASLPEWAIARAMVTCTEAKAAALQELMIASRYSNGIATGSGTDGTIVISNRESSLRLTDAGKHSKLGELIGKCVKQAVSQALYLQTGVCPKAQHTVLRRVERYGINEAKIQDCAHRTERNIQKDKLYQLNHDSSLVVQTSLYVHLLDQLGWGLLSPEEAENAGRVLVKGILELTHVRYTWRPINVQNKEQAVRDMTENFTFLLSALAEKW